MNPNNYTLRPRYAKSTRTTYNCNQFLPTSFSTHDLTTIFPMNLRYQLPINFLPPSVPEKKLGIKRIFYGLDCPSHYPTHSVRALSTDSNNENDLVLSNRSVERQLVPLRRMLPFSSVMYIKCEHELDTIHLLKGN